MRFIHRLFVRVVTLRAKALNEICNWRGHRWGRVDGSPIVTVDGTVLVYVEYACDRCNSHEWMTEVEAVIDGEL